MYNEKKHVSQPELTISEMAVSCGVPEHKIRYYEREGLISPARYDNEYRYFSMNEIYLALNGQLLHSLGFSMDEVVSIMHDADKQDFCKALERLETDIESQLEKLLATRRRIWELQDHLEEKPGEIRFKHRGALYGVYSTKSRYYDVKNTQLKLAMQEINSHLPQCYMSYTIEPEMLNDPSVPFLVEWGRFTSQPLYNAGDMLVTIPPSLCICGMVETKPLQLNERETFEPFIRFAHDNGYEICGKAMGEIFNHYGKDNGLRHYSVSIPVRPKNG